MNKQAVNNFIEHIKKECAQHGISVIIKPYGEISYNGIFCNGYFCDIKKELAFWYDKDRTEWFLVAVHEFSHFLQWSKNRSFWDELVHDGDYSVNLLDNWLSGQDFREEAINKIIENNIQVEYDCERRAVELIKNFQLPIAINDYIQKANSYVLFYHIVKKQRSFYEPNKEPYSIASIYQEMPDYFLEDPIKGSEVEPLVQGMLDKYKELS